MKMLKIKICKSLVSNLPNMNNFQPLEVVDRGSEKQSQVVKIFKKITQQDKV